METKQKEVYVAPEAQPLVVDPEPGSDVYYVYPADMVNSEAQMNYSALDTQDGTLETVAPELDDTGENGLLDYRLIRPATPD